MKVESKGGSASRRLVVAQGEATWCGPRVKVPGLKAGPTAVPKAEEKRIEALCRVSCLI